MMVVRLSTDPGVTSWNPQCGHITFMDHGIISMVILPLPLIQEGHLSVIGESMCTKYFLTA